MIKTPEQSIRSSLLLPAAAAIFVAVIFWAKSGLVPAASTGDEMWFSDAPYFFLKDGIFRTPILDDDTGRGVCEILLNMTAIVQIGMLWLFGVTPFGILVQIALTCSLIMVGVYLLCRNLDASKNASMLASVAIWGSFVAERQLDKLRCEAWTTIATIFSILLLLKGHPGNGLSKKWSLAMAGVFLGIGLTAYFPQSPAFLLAWLVAFFILFGINFKASAWTALGFSPIALGYAAWLAVHWGFFQSQVIHVGVEHYLSASNIISPFKALLYPSDFSVWLEAVENLAMLSAAALCVIQCHDRRIKAVAAMAATSSLPMFMYDIPRLSAPSVLMISVLFALAAKSGSIGLHPRSRIAELFKVSLIVLALVKLSLLAATAVLQYEGRRYDPVVKSLRETITQPGPVAISKRAWLALREITTAENLHFLPFTHQTLPNIPKAAKGEGALLFYRYLVLEPETLPTLYQHYPWIKQGIASGAFKLVKSIRPKCLKLPWAPQHVYNLDVYERK